MRQGSQRCSVAVALHDVVFTFGTISDNISDNSQNGQARGGGAADTGYWEDAKNRLWASEFVSFKMLGETATLLGTIVKPVPLRTTKPLRLPPPARLPGQTGGMASGQYALCYCNVGPDRERVSCKS